MIAVRCSRTLEPPQQWSVHVPVAPAPKRCAASAREAASSSLRCRAFSAWG
ncbi:hypothetical protein GGD71_006542 [Variovorax guangxiensis]|uniref:Uncharacterized protein n=1 Tax=Variovorax guangxiensis TaxID=1775474 RepID=A0A840G2C0_9BURK|nr:hypothetical protein [Variovorax guangxiensis]